MEGLRNFDPTLEKFNFNRTTSEFKIDQEQIHKGNLIRKIIFLFGLLIKRIFFH